MYSLGWTSVMRLWQVFPNTLCNDYSWFWLQRLGWYSCRGVSTTSARCFTGFTGSRLLSGFPVTRALFCCTNVNTVWRLQTTMILTLKPDNNCIPPRHRPLLPYTFGCLPSVTAHFLLCALICGTVSHHLMSLLLLLSPPITLVLNPISLSLVPISDSFSFFTRSVLSHSSLFWTSAVIVKFYIFCRHTLCNSVTVLLMTDQHYAVQQQQQRDQQQQWEQQQRQREQQMQREQQLQKEQQLREQQLRDKQLLEQQIREQQRLKEQQVMMEQQRRQQQQQQAYRVPAGSYAPTVCLSLSP